MGGKNLAFRGILGVLIVIIIIIFALAGLITDYYWFDALGYSTIFLISLKAKIALFFLSGLIFVLFAGANLWFASKFNHHKKSIIPFKLKAMIILILGFIVGMSSSSAWFKTLQYLKQVPFNIQDPIFLKDVSFYIFSLPFFMALWKFAFACVIITTIIVLAEYLHMFLLNLAKPPNPTPNPNPASGIPKKVVDVKSIWAELKRTAIIHSGLLITLIFVLFAIKHYLSRFSIMYSKEGIVVGAGYADVVAYLPIVKILMILAVVVAILCLIWIFYISKEAKLRKKHIVIYAILTYIVIVFLGPTLIPGMVQVFKVAPNEINLEKPYIENNIKFTRIAYGLNDVEAKDFPVEMGLNPDILYNASETIDNVRILDWRPLTQTYKQTQEIRLYYDLSGIDIDRYNIDGKYTQVMLAPRELAQSQITSNAKTWVNLHMVYTHGFGVVMSPVNKVTKQGLPDYFIKDIPPVYTVEEDKIKINQSRVYYGEMENNYVLVNTNTNEFDFPKGDTNEYINYDGTGGVILDSFFTKLLMAIRFADIKILLSSDITPESKIMYMRNIQERVSKIMPFLGLDKDPYLVIDEGRLYWMQDAYTISDKFPYSEKIIGLNYIRNSVKVVVDAYDGDVKFYVMDIKDPLVMTYANMFPKQFMMFNSMPDGLKEHIRYPEDLFSIQAEIYNTYHMDDPTVFYNKEDAWQIPYEIYGVGQQVTMQPYYIIMKIPGEDKEEFLLMTPFTPISKNNMIAWMAGRSDGADYGKLILYKFPKDKLIYGPSQVEAKIDQDSEISQQLTLWSQQGSQVMRGNLLVIPIDDSILYVEPLYIQAEKGQLPELKRVLVSDGERVVMEHDLKTGLEVLFGKKKNVIEEKEDKTFDELVSEAQGYYDNILDAMDSGNWTGFGDNFDMLGEVLGEIG